jgi:hypothetical protein
MSKQFDRAENHIHDSLRTHPHDMSGVYRELNNLRHHESHKQFTRDLAHINEHLHQQGLLPHLQIVESSKTRSGFSLRPDGSSPGDRAARPAPHNDSQPGEASGAGHSRDGHHGRRQGGGGRRGGDHSNDGGGSDPVSYDGAHRAGANAKESAQIVASIAKRMGVDPVTAVATMLVESRGNPHAIGDHGTSFGLFQLHRGGALGHLSKEQAFDPVTNVTKALKEWQPNLGRYHNPGELAAASQRPAHRAAYARMVNGSLAEARALLGMT